jgi:hypothetical protein
MIKENEEKYSEQLIVIEVQDENGEAVEGQDKIIYQIRPYTLDFIRGVKLFYDIIIFSKLPIEHLMKIRDHIETVLNKPLLE